MSASACSRQSTFFRLLPRFVTRTHGAATRLWATVCDWRGVPLSQFHRQSKQHFLYFRPLYELVDTELRSTDPLNFTDLKP